MTGSGEKVAEGADDGRRTRIRGVLGGLLNAGIMGALLFLPAGTPDWPMAWVLLAITIASFTAHSLAVSPDLIEERSRRHENAKSWDRYLVAIIVLTGFAMMVVAGLDIRFGWTGPLPPAVQAASVGIVILSCVLVIWATTSNPFFSAVIRIQSERGHVVVSGGPYRYVRHPGYAGWILYMLALPLMLGSVAALLPGAIAAGLDLVRTHFEDRFLMEELPGYREYAARVRYRLVPGVW